jgi:hypothetical protein
MAGIGLLMRELEIRAHGHEKPARAYLIAGEAAGA